MSEHFVKCDTCGEIVRQGESYRRHAASHEALERQPTDHFPALMIGEAIQRAAKDLPEGWQIVATIERGAGTVKLLDRAGDDVEFATNNESFSYEVHDALATAIEMDNQQYRERCEDDSRVTPADRGLSHWPC